MMMAGYSSAFYAGDHEKARREIRVLIDRLNDGMAELARLSDITLVHFQVSYWEGTT